MKKLHLSFIIFITAITCLGCNGTKQIPRGDTNSSEIMTAATETETPLSLESAAPEPEQLNLLHIFDEDLLKTYFASFDQATFIIYDGENKIIYNETLADTRIDPYSTFKIPNTIIGLETGSITQDNNFKKWDGTRNSREIANQDHDLASAFENSIVWYYQDLARDIGAENMSRYLTTMSYGNKDISGGIDKFWLGSSLKITPLEQIEFLKQFYYNTFQFSDQTVETVKSIMKQKDIGLDIYGKSGSSADGMSWFVGYLMFKDKPYFFVTYLEDTEIKTPAKAYTIEMFTQILLNK